MRKKERKRSGFDAGGSYREVSTVVDDESSRRESQSVKDVSLPEIEKNIKKVI